MESVLGQIERLKKVYSNKKNIALARALGFDENTVTECKTDTALARALGVDKNTVSVWKNRNEIPANVLKKVSKNENISLDWLLSGVGQMEIMSSDEQFQKILAESDLNRKVSNLLQYAPKPFIEQLITRLEEFKRLSDL